MSLDLEAVRRGGLRAALEGPGVRLSTGAMIGRAGEWLFARVEGGIVFGLGGRPEPGESLVEALRRELKEEAGLTGDVVDSPVTQLFWGGGPARMTLPAGEPRPVFIWRQQTAGVIDLAGYVCAVYRVNVREEPARNPGDRVEGFVWLSGPALAGRGPLRVGQPGVRGPGLEPGAELSLVGSAAFAGRWLLSVQGSDDGCQGLSDT